MRIMHFSGGGDVGGAKTHILSLGKELSRQNDFHLLSFREGAFADEGRAMGLDVTSISGPWNLIRGLRNALKAVDQFKPEVIHCHGAKANMMGVLVKKLRGVPLVTTVHSDPYRDYMGSWFKQFLFGGINLWALKRMDYYMAVAERMRVSLIEHGFDPQRIFVIYNGLDFSQAPSAPEREPEGDIVVGIAARLTPIKNIPLLLQAFAAAYRRNPRLRLKIAGSGEDEAELKALAQRLGVAERVDFVGWVTDMRGFFAGVDINVLSSLSETFPYSLLEGAYQHCAAIASDVGGIPMLIEHQKTGFLFASGDADTFAEYIYRLSVDGELRRELAENLFQRASRDYSLARMCELQLAAYDAISRRARQRERRRGVVICGAYGRGNAGDEAILQAIVSQMREIDVDMPLTVMSRNKEETRLRNHTNAIYIFNVPAFIRHLRRSKIFINGGGSLIQDVTSSRSLYFYLFTLWAARLCGCRVIMYGCGIGPIKRQHNRRIAGRMLDRNVEVITLRDSGSLKVLEEMRVRRPQIKVSADPTVNIARANPEIIARAFAAEDIPADAPKIGFCLRNWPSFNNPAAIAAAADYAAEKYGLLPVFIPIELPKDIDAAARVTALMRQPYKACTQRYMVEELTAMLGSMTMVVGMRLHSLIFATSGGAPVIGVSYDAKVDSFLRDIGNSHCYAVGEIEAAPLCAAIDAVYEQGREQVELANQRLMLGERINIEAARALLEG
ncbi:MAG: polysaccharide pyruvyl transferase CsaB [Bacillota bacterium]|nr:polysaccharide pyruvyl transferase CsaB [Bacillota bacterium]